MKKILTVLLAFLLTGTLILFCITLNFGFRQFANYFQLPLWVSCLKVKSSLWKMWIGDWIIRQHVKGSHQHLGGIFKGTALFVVH